MAMLAYEKAADGDYSVVTELSELLSDPYDLLESSEAVAEKWFVKTPYWAQSMPGAEFMSCSS
jgi:serine/tyrosine/threonine adenylyltransferase